MAWNVPNFIITHTYAWEHKFPNAYYTFCDKTLLAWFEEDTSSEDDLWSIFYHETTFVEVSEVNHHHTLPQFCCCMSH